MIVNKLERLIIPSVIFSVLYIFIFRTNEMKPTLVVYQILNGVGHMWFLPMLFGCFVVGWPIIQSKWNQYIILLLLFALSLISYVPLPLRLGSMLYYLPFFLAGTIVYDRWSEKIKCSVNAKRIILLWVAYILLFTFFSFLNRRIDTADATIIVKALYGSLSLCGKIIYAAFGIAAVYATASFYCRDYSVPEKVLSFGRYCFGIYLFQQFILQILYYKTSIPRIVGPIWLPWVGCIVALALSWVMSYIFFKTRTGRFLIG